MAKQKHGQSNHHPPRSRRPPHPPHFLAYPSLSVLSILATIAAGSQTVDGSPLPPPTPPPSFLCPSVDSANCTPPPTATSSTVTSSPSPASPTSFEDGGFGQVADKYVQGYDGRWRKADAWVLFGSTCCPSSSALPVESTAPVSTSQTEALDAVLPAGWSTSTESSDERTDSMVILALAVILAVSICVFMVGCIFWRRRRKKQLKREKTANDVELKVRHKANIDDPSEDGDKEREARGKLHLWAKASARWKANIRHSARRRKNRRHLVSTGKLSRPQSPILTQAPEVSIPSSTPSSSRRSSIAPTCEDPHTAITHSPVNSSATAQPPPSPVPPSPGTVSSPPAYIFPAQQRPSMFEGCLQEVSHLNRSGDASHRKSQLSDRRDFSPVAEGGDIPYQSSYAGHVAIDDKAHLAHLASLASAPPANEDITEDGSLAAHESAPEWHDDPEEDYFCSDITTPVIPSLEIGTSGFPAPPSKSLFSFRYFDGHSHLEDITALDPVILPSMPPYEQGPSAVPFEEEPHASAPPLTDDDHGFECWESNDPEASDGRCDTHFSSSPAQPNKPCAGGNGALPIYQP